MGRVSVWEDEEALAVGAGGSGVSGQLGLRGNTPFQKTNQPNLTEKRLDGGDEDVMTPNVLPNTAACLKVREMLDYEYDIIILKNQHRLCPDEIKTGQGDNKRPVCLKPKKPHKMVKTCHRVN